MTDIILIHKILQNVYISCEILFLRWKTSAVSMTVWMVETQLCKLRGTSDTLHNMFLWTINKSTMWLLILSFTKNRSRVFYFLSLWRIYCIKNTTVWNLTPPPANLALIPQQHVIHQASKYNRYTLSLFINF